MDAARLRESFTRVSMHGEEVPLFFYAYLFLHHPELRDMFPVSMAAQRDRLWHALGRIISSADTMDELTPFLQGLGRDHRKFGVTQQQYGHLRESMLATLARFSGDDWAPELGAGWAAAYDRAAQIMIDAAAADAEQNPATWDATVITHELRSFQIAVFRVATLQQYRYLAGQSAAIESELRPRIWRLYSMANAPREDGTLDFHVRMLDGGVLSMPLVRSVVPGSRLRLGAPMGTLTLDTGSGRAVLLVAGSTGLAPVKAILEQLAQRPEPPATRLFFGARRAEDLYDLPALEKFSAARHWLTVTASVSEDAGYPGEQGSLPDVVARSGSWSGHDAYVAGSAEMTAAMTKRLITMGVPRTQVHVEDFGWSEP